MANLPSAPIYITIEESQMGSVATESLAQAIGQSNNWIVDNSKGKPVGSIQYSTLTLGQFQAVAGVGWVLANGAPLLITDQLRIITGLTTVPDMRGTFQRAITGVETITGTTLAPVNPNHTHAVSITHSVAQTTPNTRDLFGGAFNTDPWSLNAGLKPIPTVIGNGSTEFFPKYCVLNAFMRIN